MIEQEKAEICELKSKIICHEEEMNVLKHISEGITEGTIRVELEDMHEDIEEDVNIHPKVDKYLILKGLKW